MNVDTGMITSIGILDREAINLELNGVIELNVTATDMGEPPLSSWLIAIINVDVSLDFGSFLKAWHPVSYHSELQKHF